MVFLPRSGFVKRMRSWILMEFSDSANSTSLAFSKSDTRDGGFSPSVMRGSCVR